MIHPQSYVHSIIRFKNGLIKMILYNSDMKIPISNILYGSKKNILNIKKIDTKTLNNLSFQEVSVKKFPSVNLIKRSLKFNSSIPTIMNASNEVLVDMFLNKKIGFLDIVRIVGKIFKDEDFNKYATRKLSSINDIKIIDKWARLKTISMCVR